MQLSDLSHFTVDSIALEGRDWVLHGHFNHIEHVTEGSCWLYLPSDYSYHGTLEALSRDTLRARFNAGVEEPPADLAVGSSVPWIDGYWEIQQVSTVLDQAHVWRRVVFEASDSLVCSTPQGRWWRKADGATQTDSELVFPSGWDHEHCLICYCHIDPGHTAFTDPDDQWLCQQCHAKYALTNDLRFMFGEA